MSLSEGTRSMISPKIIALMPPCVYHMRDGLQTPISPLQGCICMLEKWESVHFILQHCSCSKTRICHGRLEIIYYIIFKDI